MKTFLIAAISTDGYIAKDENHSAFWTGKEDKRRFVELTKRAGVVVMGSTTFATLPRPLRERTNIVYSRSNKVFDGAETTQKSPAELLEELKDRGFKEVAICGGSHIYTMFMKARLVDRIYITIEPIIFGKGIRLFNEDLLFHLKLETCGQTENGAILLEYSVDYTGKPKV